MKVHLSICSLRNFKPIVYLLNEALFHFIYMVERNFESAWTRFFGIHFTLIISPILSQSVWGVSFTWSVILNNQGCTNLNFAWTVILRHQGVYKLIFYKVCYFETPGVYKLIFYIVCYSETPGVYKLIFYMVC